MKLPLLYGLSLVLAWVGLASLAAGLEAWPRPGAWAPTAAGLALLAGAARLLLALVRQYRSPAVKRGRGLLD